jgi:hypothetical protein
LPGIITTTIGAVVDESRSYPILACVTDVGLAPGRPWVLISAGVHGDEIAGVATALEFLEARAGRLSGAFRLVVLPCVNPTGFECNTLATADGANLNRLFGTGSRQPEIVALEAWLSDQDRPFLATFDLHEISPTYRGEGFVESDNPRACYLYETQADPHRRLGRALIDALPPSIEVCRDPFIYHDFNDQGVVPYPEACRNPIYAQGTTFDAYLHGRHTGHAFTLETPMGWPMEKRVRTQLIWLDEALSRLRAAGASGPVLRQAPAARPSSPP